MESSAVMMVYQMPPGGSINRETFFINGTMASVEYGFYLKLFKVRIL